MVTNSLVWQLTKNTKSKKNKNLKQPIQGFLCGFFPIDVDYILKQVPLET